MIASATRRSGQPMGTTVAASARMIMPNESTLACQAWQPRSWSVHTEQRPYGWVLRLRLSTQLALTDVDIRGSFRSSAHQADPHQQIPAEHVIAAAGAEADG